MRDSEILEEFYVIQEYERLRQENRKNFEPYCTACDYIGQPHYNTEYCPECGGEMRFPARGANHVTASDDNVIETLEEDLGIKLSTKDKKSIENL